MQTIVIMQATIEIFQQLQQLQITLHLPTATSASATGQLRSQCSVSNQYPYKPILHIQLISVSAPANSTPVYSISLPLSVRIDVNDLSSRSTATANGDAIILRFKIKQDLSEEEGENDFPTSRELVTAEYPSLYCRHCSTSIFASRTSPFQVHPLPSPYWSELTDLWFCHTTNNAHVQQIANTTIRAMKDRILVDKLLLRVHKDDLLLKGESWRREESAKKLLETLQQQPQVALEDQPPPLLPPEVHAMHDVSSSSSTSAAPLARDMWCPLPCSNSSCPAMIGSILLTLSASSNLQHAVQPSHTGEVRLFKYQLSNCFRKKDEETSSSTRMETPKGAEDNAMQDDTPSTSTSSVTVTSVKQSPIPSCLCSSYSSSPLLTCANMFIYYSFENCFTEDLLQRFNKQPIGKFIIESQHEEDADAEAVRQLGGSSMSGSGGSNTTRKQKLFIRLFVTQWDHRLSSSLSSISSSLFPYTPNFLQSNVQIPVIAVEFQQHHSEQEESVGKWIYGKKYSATNNTMNVSLPSNIERIVMPHDDCVQLLSLLEARTTLWPKSCATGISDMQMRKSCLVKLTKKIKLS